MEGIQMAKKQKIGITKKEYKETFTTKLVEMDNRK